jgi:hypothetical protein
MFIPVWLIIHIKKLTIEIVNFIGYFLAVIIGLLIFILFIFLLGFFS